MNNIEKNLYLFTEISQESQNQPTLLWNLVSAQNLNFFGMYLFLPFFTFCRCSVCNDFCFLFDGSFVSMMADIIFNSWFQFFRVTEDGPSFDIRHVSHQPRGPSRPSSFTSWTAFCECFVGAGTDFCLMKNCSDFCKLRGCHFKDNGATLLNCSQEI